MRYLLLVLTPPDLGPSARHALQFARAVARSEHEIACVFFFDAGALTALQSEAAPEEDDLREGWQALARDHGVSLVACVASAQRFGTAGDGAHNGAFEIAGLGSLIEASIDADRVLTFRG